MRIVNHSQRFVFFSELDDPFKVRDRAVHREAAIGCEQSISRTARFAQLGFEINHIVILVTEPLRFTQPDAVDNAGVI